MKKLTVTVLLAMVFLAGCGVADRNPPAAPDLPAAADLAEALYPEAEALEAMGFGAIELAAAGPQASAEPTARPSTRPDGRDGWRKRQAVRVFVNRNVLHGEAVVQTRDGTKTIVVQRGTVTAVTGTTLTVKSADGFTLQWTFGDPLHVIEHRTTIQPSQIAVGADVGVAGGKDGDTSVARLVVIPRMK